MADQIMPDHATMRKAETVGIIPSQDISLSVNDPPGAERPPAVRHMYDPIASLPDLVTQLEDIGLSVLL